MRTPGDTQSSPEPAARVNVLGVGISVLNLESALAGIAEAIAQRRKGYICVTGVHGVSEAQHDTEFRRILNHALLCTPDGMPMVWMGRLAGHREMRRVYGPDLMARVCAAGVDRGWRHLLYGGGPGVASDLQRSLETRHPGVKVVGTFTPPFRALNAIEQQELKRLVAAAKPDLFWVGLSTPKQERFMAEYLPQLDVPLMLGVGAAFDLSSGRLRQAPRWVQRAGLEWLFRLCQEPRRLWKRYLKNNPLFIARAVCQLTGLRRYPLD